MTILALIFIPLAAGIAALLIKGDWARRLMLPVVAGLHSLLTLSAWVSDPGAAWGGWLMLDSLGLLFLSITSALFLAASFYCVGYLETEVTGDREDFVDRRVFSNAPQARFVAFMLFFLASMTFVAACRHFGLIWVGVEATTLASAPLIYFHRHARSLEATWKYLIVCSVGIALALMGYMLLAISASGPSGESISLTVESVLGAGSALNGPWLRAAFIFFVVGYGTKVGLAPLHTWLPDAHSEAPSVVSALLSGALLNCAFLGILRALEVLNAAGQGAFGREILAMFGLFSMAVAAVFIIGQKDYKRMLAYSSVEHMGIISLGIGIGGGAAFGAVLHAVNHSLAKGMLFLLAGNILAVYRTKASSEVKGVVKLLPASGALWLLGFLAITGSPPFGPFMSEFAVLRGALGSGHTFEAAAYLALLAIIFIGMAGTFLKMTQGVPEAVASGRTRPESFAMTLPPMALAAAVTVLGVYVPLPLQTVLHRAAALLGGS